MTTAPPAIAFPESAEFEVLHSLLNARTSCRAFLDQRVPREVIERILCAAQRTASWCNAQPWQVHIVQGEPLERLRTAMYAMRDAVPAPDLEWPREYRGVYQERRRACGWGLYEAVGIAKGDRVASARQAAENMRMFGAPHVAIVSSDEALGTYGAVDCGAYVSNFMLAARSLGVGCVAQAALASQSQLLREHLGIGSDRLIVCGISFGYPDTTHPANRWRTTRAPMADAAVWVE